MSTTRAMLIDLTRCIGCRGCQAACKQWHDLPGEQTRNRGSYENPPALSAQTWTSVTFHEVEYEGRLAWVFAKRQCMHCEQPACASACTVGALRKTPEGPVGYDAGKCISCRYCLYVCPFGVPGYEWNQPLGLIGKCDFCVDRQQSGLSPACTKSCPTEAIEIGRRDDLVREARARIARHPGRYVSRVYGEREVGGTSMLYLSAVPFNAIDFPELGDRPVAHDAEALVGQTPVIAGTVALAASGLYWILQRREGNRNPTTDNTDEDEG